MLCVGWERLVFISIGFKMTNLKTTWLSGSCLEPLIMFMCLILMWTDNKMFPWCLSDVISEISCYFNSDRKKHGSCLEPGPNGWLLWRSIMVNTEFSITGVWTILKTKSHNICSFDFYWYYPWKGRATLNSWNTPLVKWSLIRWVIIAAVNFLRVIAESKWTNPHWCVKVKLRLNCSTFCNNSSSDHFSFISLRPVIAAPNCVGWCVSVVNRSLVENKKGNVVQLWFGSYQKTLVWCRAEIHGELRQKCDASKNCCLNAQTFKAFSC